MFIQNPEDHWMDVVGGSLDLVWRVIPKTQVNILVVIILSAHKMAAAENFSKDD